MVLSTNDPDALEEVWFVLSKAMGSSSNDEIRNALKYAPAPRVTRRIADYLIKNTGARFHNTCTPLFMRRLKEMILVAAPERVSRIDKGKDGRRRQHASDERRARNGACLG